MRTGLAALVVALSVGACSQAHVVDGDAGADAPSLPSCGGPAPFVCVRPVGGGVCEPGGPPGCLDGGTWQCPVGTSPEPLVSCDCIAPAPDPSCACLSSGWWCESLDAGMPGCPADWATAEGTPCTPEGTSCGRCVDSCGFCNLLVCSGGTWSHLEAPPPPPPCTSFPCGPALRCAAETEYCARAVSDIGGEPDSFACQRLPDGCPSADDCDCIPAGWSSCERGAEGGLLVVYPGG